MQHGEEGCFMREVCVSLWRKVPREEKRDEREAGATPHEQGCHVRR